MPAAQRAWAAILQTAKSNCRKHTFAENIKSSILRNLHFRGNRPQNPDYDDVNSIKNLK